MTRNSLSPLVLSAAELRSLPAADQVLDKKGMPKVRGRVRMSAGQQVRGFQRWIRGLLSDIGGAGPVQVSPPNPSDRSDYVWPQKPTFAPTSPQPEEVDQLLVANCYYEATLSALARSKFAPDLRRIIRDDGTLNVIVSFWRSGTRTDVKQTRQIPAPLASRNAGVWGASAEKAYAYFRTGANTYGSMGWGSSGPAFSDLGYVTSRISVATNLPVETTIAACASNKLPMTALTRSTVAPGSDLAAKHYYDVVDYNPATGKVRLRNPWDYAVSVTLDAFKQSFSVLFYATGRVAGATLPEATVITPLPTVQPIQPSSDKWTPAKLSNLRALYEPYKQFSGTSLTDYSGNGRTATFGSSTAAPAWGPTGIVFDGSNDTVSLPSMGITTGALTCHIFYTPTSASGDRGLMQYGNLAETWGFQMFQSFVGGTRGYGFPSANYQVSTPILSAAAHGVTLTFGPTGGMKLYTDGALRSTDASPASNLGATDLSVSGVQRILGRVAFGASFSGTIHAVVFTAGELTAAEVTQLHDYYTAELAAVNAAWTPAKMTGVRAVYEPLRGGAGALVLDQSSNVANGTLANGTWSGGGVTLTGGNSGISTPLTNANDRSAYTAVLFATRVGSAQFPRLVSASSAGGNNGHAIFQDLTNFGGYRNAASGLTYGGGGIRIEAGSGTRPVSICIGYDGTNIIGHTSVASSSLAQASNGSGMGNWLIGGGASISGTATTVYAALFFDRAISQAEFLQIRAYYQNLLTPSGVTLP